MGKKDDARETLKAFLDDMSALQKWFDPGNPDAAEFVEAFGVARKRAKQAAREYARAFGDGAGGD